MRLFCCGLYDTDTHMYPCGLLINKDDGLYVLAMSINAVVFVDIYNSFFVHLSWYLVRLLKLKFRVVVF